MLRIIRVITAVEAPNGRLQLMLWTAAPPGT
jgi:hypothetical protein